MAGREVRDEAVYNVRDARSAETGEIVRGMEVTNGNNKLGPLPWVPKRTDGVHILRDWDAGRTQRFGD